MFASIDKDGKVTISDREVSSQADLKATLLALTKETKRQEGLDQKIKP